MTCCSNFSTCVFSCVYTYMCAVYIFIKGEWDLLFITCHSIIQHLFHINSYAEIQTYIYVLVYIYIYSYLYMFIYGGNGTRDSYLNVNTYSNEIRIRYFHIITLSKRKWDWLFICPYILMENGTQNAWPTVI